MTTAIAAIRGVAPITTITIRAEELLNAGNSLFTEVNNNALFFAAFAAAHGGGTAAMVPSANRRLLVDENLTISITYALSVEEYESIPWREIGSPEFLAALAAELGGGVDVSSVQSAGGSSVRVEFSVDDAGGGGGVTTLKALVAAVAAVVDTMDDLDLCAARSCSGRGACREGVCACEGDWWGIDCEVPCVCQNGGVCNGPACTCPYPYFGMACGEVKNCEC